MLSPNKIEEEAKYHSIDNLTSERRTYLDSEQFNYQGGNYSYNSCSDFCEQFIRSFKRHNENDYCYMEQLKNMANNQALTFVISYDDICEAHVMEEEVYHSNFLHYLLIQNPRLFIKAMRKASFDVLQTVNYDYAMDVAQNFKATLSNAAMFKKEITEINNDDVGHLIYSEDFVISISTQKDFTKSMAWFCGECGRLTYKPTVAFKLPKIRRCMFCNSEDITESNKDAITDTMQEIKIQQRYEKITSGRVPKTMMGVIFGKDMMNKVRAGDICSLTGIIDIQRNFSPNENAIADYYIEILWVEPKSDDFLIEEDPELESKVKTFVEPDNEDEGYSNLIQSIAPSVMGHEILKEALLLQLVGSDVGYFGDNSRHRGEINILLVGDAATAKTKLAYYAYQLYARSIYISGKVTEAGITANVDVTNRSLGHAVLEAGAYLLASSDNGGLVVADEMEKTDFKAKDAISSCLDDRQMVEIHKAGVHQSIQINCASLHIANPRTGEAWNPDLTIRENTGFENWYLSRFCSWIVRDEVDKELDTKKAKHYLDQFGNTVRQYKLKDSSLNDIRRKQALSYEGNKHIKSVPEMRMFCKYARSFHPEIDPKSKAAQKLIKFYLAIRPSGVSTKSFKVSMRSLGDLVRFSEASARAHYRSQVLEKDADIAIKIVSSSIASSGFNVLTGKYEEQQEQNNKKKKNNGEAVGDIPPGWFSANDLLQNRTANEIVGQDLDSLAIKRQNRFYKEVATKMKKVVKAVKMYGLQRCRDCHGEGHKHEGNLRSMCYSCSGAGGYKATFDINELSYTLTNVGLSTEDIHKLTEILIKKKVIAPTFEGRGNGYQVVKGYRDALLDLAGIEANISLAIDLETERNRDLLVKSPEMQQKIEKLKHLMPSNFREKLRKSLGDVEEEEEDEEDDEEHR